MKAGYLPPVNGFLCSVPGRSWIDLPPDPFRSRPVELTLRSVVVSTETTGQLMNM